jgi:hypothetical protein
MKIVIKKFREGLPKKFNHDNIHNIVVESPTLYKVIRRDEKYYIGWESGYSPFTDSIESFIKELNQGGVYSNVRYDREGQYDHFFPFL